MKRKRGTGGTVGQAALSQLHVLFFFTIIIVVVIIPGRPGARSQLELSSHRLHPCCGGDVSG